MFPIPDVPQCLLLISGNEVPHVVRVMLIAMVAILASKAFRA